ncbi:MULTISPECIES: TFIIB-type zinc ribbon-containing protein [Salinibaculum]|uniref:TFIIB-type zinc ribbon-containing protein n=1 Tax=Salinibaculum TaxID=2732368 RepID=UPI0030CDA629
MKLRGERQCTDCGTRWSYYETGEITCPECGSVRSVGVGDHAEHTDSPVELDLQPAIEQVDTEPLGTVAETAADQARQYLHRAGFVDAGRLKPFGDTYLVAAELRRVGATLSRAMRVDDDEELYLLSLLRGGADGERPPPAEVPDSLRAERGLAVAAAVDAYVSDLRRVQEDPERPVAEVLSAVRDRRKRIEALDGDVEPEEAERIVRAVRDLSAYLREGDETALVRAGDRFEGS